jgi:hypothetical protein
MPEGKTQKKTIKKGYSRLQYRQKHQENFFDLYCVVHQSNNATILKTYPLRSIVNPYAMIGERIKSFLIDFSKLDTTKISKETEILKRL